MKRKIIRIDENKCDGCGSCVTACHEGAIGLVNGKAKLLRDDYCDGLGDCLPECPAGAIAFEEREAAPYDAAAVLAHKAKKEYQKDAVGTIASELNQWPVQIKLVPVHAPYFAGADLLIAADCTAYAYGNFHRKFLSGKSMLLGCPKLDAVDYSQKLTEILKENEIQSITIVRMEVPCCGGLEMAVKKALRESGKEIPLQVVTISTDGKILD